VFTEKGTGIRGRIFGRGKSGGSKRRGFTSKRGGPERRKTRGKDCNWPSRVLKKENPSSHPESTERGEFKTGDELILSEVRPPRVKKKMTHGGIRNCPVGEGLKKEQLAEYQLSVGLRQRERTFPHVKNLKGGREEIIM